MKPIPMLRLVRTLAATGVACALSLSFTPGADAGQGHRGTPGRGAPFTGVYAFGDSLTDTGNFFDLTGLPPEPYFDGRFSNGFVWIDYLAVSLEMDPGSVVNYAVGGATTGRDNENDIPGVAEFPGLQDEIDLFENDLNGRAADRRALYAVWAGANDFFVSTGDPAETVATGVANTVMAVQRLYQLGARRIMVVNLPDLGLTPYGIETGTGAVLSYLTAVYNNSLDAALDQLENAGIGTIRVDSAATLQDMAGNPDDFGFSNVGDAYLLTGGDPSGFLFWDPVHPTTQGHFYLAQAATQSLRRQYPHAWTTPRAGRR